MEETRWILLSLVYVGLTLITVPHGAGATCNTEGAGRCVPNDVTFNADQHCTSGVLNENMADSLWGCVERHLESCAESVTLSDFYAYVYERASTYLNNMADQCQQTADCIYTCSVEYMTSQRYLTKPQPEPGNQNENEADEKWDDNELFFGELHPFNDFLEPFETPTAEEQKLYCGHLGDVTPDDVEKCLSEQDRCTNETLRKEIRQRFRYRQGMCEEGCENFYERENITVETCDSNLFNNNIEGIILSLNTSSDATKECRFWEKYINCIRDNVGNCEVAAKAYKGMYINVLDYGNLGNWEEILKRVCEIDLDFYTGSAGTCDLSSLLLPIIGLLYALF